ncbi:uncharacterized protein LOC129291696 isoform X2 [Prosopis cineraria]|uniref:uncharacterized protein LOC129291696 isoform X2 n=2 Tax=Prosopis cineraria TaxID=364024 RepID=UPI00241063BD|nr:uncharacterized protein LOC129291696 isoform X2 [Prosopis cineraria]
MSERGSRDKGETSDSKPGIKDIIHGLGKRKTKLGDQVRIKYQLLGESGKVEDEKGPFDLTLGARDHTYGQGLDEGVRGMKIEGTRELKIGPEFCPQDMPNNWRKIVGLPQKEKAMTFHVTLIAILNEEVEKKDGTQEHKEGGVVSST